MESALEHILESGILPEGCFADRQGTGPELDSAAVTNDESQPITVPGKLDEPSISSTEDHDATESTQEEVLDPVDDEPTEVTPTAPLPTEEHLQPTPEKPLSLPFLKTSLLEVSPPTPRDPSPVQAAMESLSPARDDPPTSPTERKEEELQLPTDICEFPVVSHDDEPDETIAEEGNLILVSINNRSQTATCRRRRRARICAP
jgi:hypothetical protein